jgi:hypothetical protein
MASQPFTLILPVPPENVTSFVRLKIPGRNQNNVSLSDPYSSLQFASNSAQSFFAVLTFHQDSVKTQHSNGYAQHIICGWQHHIFNLFFADDLSFTQFPTFQIMRT